ncbi:MAG: hypothetical protein ACLQVG_07540 [Terriglobia bacterium]
MSQQLQKFAISGLRWSVGVVVLLESLRLTFSPSAIEHFAKMGHLPWIRLALSGGEFIAAILFLVPPASLAGGCLLVFIFAIAAVLHLLHGEFDVGNLIIYSMAVIVCMTYRARKQ